MCKEQCMELLARPAASLTAVEQYAVNKFCEENPGIVDEMIMTAVPVKSPAPSKRYVYGLQGIMELFGCCRTTAQKIKNGGRINKAVTQVGRKIIIDADMALRLYSLDNPTRRR